MSDARVFREMIGIGLLLVNLWIAPASADSAEEAWNSLVAEKFSKRTEFAFIENNSTLPNVLIYGDSISIHYTNRVREQLSGKANVYRIHLNGGDSASFIPKMTLMHRTMQDSSLSDHWSFKWDVIHFNVGLHDLKYLKGRQLDKANGKQVTSIEGYEKNLRNIVAYLTEIAPAAKLIFATTTPIPIGELGRIVGDADKYNRAALKVLEFFPEVIINDIYNFTKPRHSAWWQKPGNVHYNESGRKAQGDQVAATILRSIIH